jgi:hypothetical protein
MHICIHTHAHILRLWIKRLRNEANMSKIMADLPSSAPYAYGHIPNSTKFPRSDSPFRHRSLSHENKSPNLTSEQMNASVARTPLHLQHIAISATGKASPHISRGGNASHTTIPYQAKQTHGTRASVSPTSMMTLPKPGPRTRSPSLIVGAKQQKHQYTPHTPNKVQSAAPDVDTAAGSQHGLPSSSGAHYCAWNGSGTQASGGAARGIHTSSSSPLTKAASVVINKGVGDNFDSKISVISFRATDSDMKNDTCTDTYRHEISGYTGFGHQGEDDRCTGSFISKHVNGDSETEHMNRTGQIDGQDHSFVFTNDSGTDYVHESGQMDGEETDCCNDEMITYSNNDSESNSPVFIHGSRLAGFNMSRHTHNDTQINVVTHNDDDNQDHRGNVNNNNMHNKGTTVTIDHRGTLDINTMSDNSSALPHKQLPHQAQSVHVRTLRHQCAVRTSIHNANHSTNSSAPFSQSTQDTLRTSIHKGKHSTYSSVPFSQTVQIPSKETIQSRGKRLQTSWMAGKRPVAGLQQEPTGNVSIIPQISGPMHGEHAKSTSNMHTDGKTETSQHSNFTTQTRRPTFQALRRNNHGSPVDAARQHTTCSPNKSRQKPPFGSISPQRVPSVSGVSAYNSKQVMRSMRAVPGLSHMHTNVTMAPIHAHVNNHQIESKSSETETNTNSNGPHMSPFCGQNATMSHQGECKNSETETTTNTTGEDIALDECIIQNLSIDLTKYTDDKMPRHTKEDSFGETNAFGLHDVNMNDIYMHDDVHMNDMHMNDVQAWVETVKQPFSSDLLRPSDEMKAKENSNECIQLTLDANQESTMDSDTGTNTEATGACVSIRTGADQAGTMDSDTGMNNEAGEPLPKADTSTRNVHSTVPFTLGQADLTIADAKSTVSSTNVIAASVTVEISNFDDAACVSPMEAVQRSHSGSEWRSHALHVASTSRARSQSDATAR